MFRPCVVVYYSLVLMGGEMILINLLNGDQLIFIQLLGVNLSDILFKLQKNQFQYQMEKEQKGIFSNSVVTV